LDLIAAQAFQATQAAAQAARSLFSFAAKSLQTAVEVGREAIEKGIALPGQSVITVGMYICVYICIYIYVYICIHTYIYI
jgi:hypothetical protein